MESVTGSPWGHTGSFLLAGRALLANYTISISPATIQSAYTLQVDHRVTCTTESTSGWARAGVAPAWFARGNFESWQLSLPSGLTRRHPISFFLFPESCPWEFWRTGHKGAESPCCPPSKGRRPLLCLRVAFSSDPALSAEALLLPAMERGCNRVDYVNTSAQASAVHNACQGLWSTDTCVAGYSTKYRFILSYVCRCVARASDTCVGAGRVDAEIKALRLHCGTGWKVTKG